MHNNARNMHKEGIFMQCKIEKRLTDLKKGILYKGNTLIGESAVPEENEK